MAAQEKASKAQQERVQSLLIDTVTLLCKNSIQYQDMLKVEGLLGITVDHEVFLVNINETFQEEKPESEPEEEAPSVEQSPRGSKRTRDTSPARSPAKQTNSDHVKVKQEQAEEEDEDLVIIKDEIVKSSTQSRVPPLHGASDDINYDYGMDPNYGYGSEGGMGPSPAKQRRSMPPSFHSGDSSHSSDSYAQDPNFSNLAAQVSQGVMGEEAGSFDSSGNWQPQPGTSQGNMLLVRGRGSRVGGSPGGGTRQFVCEYPGCNGAYAQRKHLVYHWKVKHASGQSMPYVCDVEGCGKRYSYPSSLYMHQRDKHGAQAHKYRTNATGIANLGQEMLLSDPSGELYLGNQSPGSDSSKP